MDKALLLGKSCISTRKTLIQGCLHIDLQPLWVGKSTMAHPRWQSKPEVDMQTNPRSWPGLLEMLFKCIFCPLWTCNVISYKKRQHYDFHLQADHQYLPYLCDCAVRAQGTPSFISPSRAFPKCLTAVVLSSSCRCPSSWIYPWGKQHCSSESGN